MSLLDEINKCRNHGGVDAYTQDVLARCHRQLREIGRRRAPRLPDFRCDNCDNGVEVDWEYCAWCGATADWKHSGDEQSPRQTEE